jgi:hypothetical protein
MFARFAGRTWGTRRSLFRMYGERDPRQNCEGTGSPKPFHPPECQFFSLAISEYTLNSTIVRLRLVKMGGLIPALRSLATIRK